MAANLTDIDISSKPTLDWKALQRFKRQFTKTIPMATEKDLKKLGIQLCHWLYPRIDKIMENKLHKASTIMKWEI